MGLSLARPGWALPSCPSPSAPLRRRCGSRCPRPGFGPASPACPRGGVLGGAALPPRTAFPSLCFWSGLTCLHGAGLTCTFALQYSGLQSGAASPGSLREHAVFLTGLLPQEPRRFGFPLGDTQYSPLPPGRGRWRAPAAADPELTAPEPPAAHPLPPAAPPALPRLRGGCCEVGKRESERSGLKIEKGSQA